MKGKILFFILAALIVGYITHLLWSSTGPLNIESKEDIKNVAIEFHGMVFDIILFGVILTIYDSIADRRDKIRRYKEEIDDFRGWDEQEAMYRIAGIIKRLNRLKTSSLDLSYVFLKDADLSEVKLRDADFSNANLQFIKLQYSDLISSTMKNTNLHKADLSFSVMRYIDLSNSDLSDAKLPYSILYKANLEGSNLQNADLDGTDLRGANLSKTDLRNTSLDDVVVKGDSVPEIPVFAPTQRVYDFFEFLSGQKPKDANFKNAQAFISQKNAFSDIMTSKQLDSIIWVEDREKTTKEA